MLLMGEKQKKRDGQNPVYSSDALKECLPNGP